jgi:hypothetical protein
MQTSPFPEKVWTKEAFKQIKKFTKKDFQKYLRKDSNWKEVNTETFLNDKLPEPHNVMTVHFHHSKETFKNTRFLRNLLNQICWTEDLLREWKAIK